MYIYKDPPIIVMRRVQMQKHTREASFTHICISQRKYISFLSPFLISTKIFSSFGFIFLLHLCPLFTISTKKFTFGVNKKKKERKFVRAKINATLLLVICQRTGSNHWLLQRGRRCLKMSSRCLIAYIDPRIRDKRGNAGSRHTNAFSRQSRCENVICVLQINICARSIMLHG